MNRNQVESSAILLRAVDYGENDRVVTLLTQTHGKVACFARSARKSSRRFRGGLGAFQPLSVRFQHRDEGLGTLHDSEATGDAMAIGGDLHKMAVGSFVFELLDFTLNEGQGGGLWFERTLRWLDWLSHETRGALHIEAGGHRMQLLLLYELGLLPDVDHCARTGSSLSESDRVYWIPGTGIISGASRFLGEPGLLIEPAVLDYLQRLLSGRFGDLRADVLHPCRLLLFDVWRHTLQAEMRSIEFYASSFR
jgi:DNA repair protein RecO (recombination protein O)